MRSPLLSPRLVNRCPASIAWRLPHERHQGGIPRAGSGVCPAFCSNRARSSALKPRENGAALLRCLKGWEADAAKVPERLGRPARSTAFSPFGSAIPRLIPDRCSVRNAPDKQTFGGRHILAGGSKQGWFDLRMPARELPDKFLVAFSLAGEQRALVKSIAEAVEAEVGAGNVFFDEWYEHHLAGNGADLKLQKIYGEQCALVVYCVSREYGHKPWTLMEHEAIRARLMKARAATERSERECILPIRVGDGEVEGVLFNAIVPDVRGRAVADIAELIVNRFYLIGGNGRTPSAPPCPAAPEWPSAQPILNWPMANHSEVRDAFAELLTSQARWRFLPLQGPSETGKSHITRHMLGNVLGMPNIACGRFDFKGTTDMDREIQNFIPELRVPVPPQLRLHERLDHILAALRQRSEPTLLIFDTYERAGEAQDWVEKQLLTSLVRATWLRVVIAGQKAPSSNDAVWSSVTQPVLHLEPPPAAEWFDYSQRHRSGMTLDLVQQVCDLANHKASLLAQLLGPPR